MSEDNGELLWKDLDEELSHGIASDYDYTLKDSQRLFNSARPEKNLNQRAKHNRSFTISNLFCPGLCSYNLDINGPNVTKIEISARQNLGLSLR